MMKDPLHHHYKMESALKKGKRIIVLLFPVALFFLSIWLVFIRYESPPLMQIEKLQQEKNWIEAEKLLQEHLKSDHLSRAKLLMYGTIIEFGLAQKLKKPPSKAYLEMLIQEDSTMVFLKESYHKKFKLFVKSPYLLIAICEYFHYFPQAGFDAISHLNAISDKTDWSHISSQCLNKLLSSAGQNHIPGYLARSRGQNVLIHEKNSLQSSPAGKLNKNETVILLSDFSKSLKKSNTNLKQIINHNKLIGWVSTSYLNH